MVGTLLGLQHRALPPHLDDSLLDHGHLLWLTVQSQVACGEALAQTLFCCPCAALQAVLKSVLQALPAQRVPLPWEAHMLAG